MVWPTTARSFEIHMAKVLGSSTGRYKDLDDVVHKKLFIKCYNRKNPSIFGWWDKCRALADKKGKIPLLFVHNRHTRMSESIAVIRLEDFLCVYEEFLRCVYGKKKDGEDVDVEAVDVVEGVKRGTLFRI